MATRRSSTLRNLLLCCCLVLAGVARAQTGAPFVAEFDPAAGIVPFPDDQLFIGSTDGTLNIPVNDQTDPASAPLLAVDSLDGFSTVAPITERFSAALDPASVRAGDTVRLFRVELVNPFLQPHAATPFRVEGIDAELVAGKDFTAGVMASDPTGRTLEIQPLRPLEPATAYMVVLTDGIRSSDGQPALPDRDYILARYRGALLDADGHSRFARLDDSQAHQLNLLHHQVVSQEDAAAAWGLRRGHIVLSWTFLTQSNGAVLKQVADHTQPNSLTLTPSGFSTADFGLAGVADLYTGSLQINYYQEAPTLIPTVILTTHWTGVNDTPVTRYNPQPVVRQRLTIPVLASIPNAASGQLRPLDGWPVVIFQHGFGQNRTSLIAIADALAQAGVAAVAIDAPLHGITDPSNPFYRGAQERTFNVDLIDNRSGKPGADGKIDPSGSHFIDLNSLLTSRDNLRQGVADLLQLAADLPQAHSAGRSTPLFDTQHIGFIGYSLGGILGGVLMGLDQHIGPVSLAMAGGGLAHLLESSEAFGPAIQAGLSAAGIAKGTPPYQTFFRLAQQVLDPADPVNYAATSSGHPLDLLEVVGPPPDAVVPNHVPGAPLSGTDPLARLLGLAPVAASSRNSGGLRVLVRFAAGSHASFLNPATASDVTREMQSEVANFVASDGTELLISDPDVLAK